MKQIIHGKVIYLSAIGEIVHELLPGKNNPRNSEGAFLDIGDGRIIFAYSMFTDNEYVGDFGRASIAAIYSYDKGKTWTNNHDILAKPESNDVINLMSVSLLRMLNGDIGFFTW